MAAEGTTVYLDDLDPSQTGTKRQRTEEAVGEKGQNDAKLAPPKRQRTLGEMTFFSGSQRRIPRSSSTSTLKSSGSSSSVVGKSSNGSTSPAKGGVKLNAIPFSLSAYQESLTDNEKRLLKLECEVMGKSWLKVLKDEIKKPYFLSLKDFLWKEGVRDLEDIRPTVKVYPPVKNIYSWSNFTPLGKVKVVIIGQDPYHGSGQAHVPHGIPIPPSLRSIYAEIKTEYPDFVVPSHGNLSAWANNGVLMLNSCLTVRGGDANSHADKGWEKFTDCVLDMVDKYGGANLPSAGGGESGFGRGVVFLAWGAYAAKRVAKLDKKKHLILTSAHPSPFSAHKGFFGNGHFRAANEWLEHHYGPESKVDWCELD
ncbi:hypothetical protein NLJ89_g3257 [Agrocybe chaxingu]|uniref:Uracil-DNA glycosylase n=1 Tax=Agrocybe chaxingu TaxID=84603 RepID=A0A9W8K5M3_9AGAR|nr:hypothetical protein NLJ89_g3257 [Agrocybe chaxingu]